MLILSQFLTIAAVFAGTFIVPPVAGPQRDNLLYTREEKEKWDAQVGGRMKSWFTRTNIVGALTSLATVYLFFIGNSKLFGWWIFLCSVSMFVGSFVTNVVTPKVWSSPHIQSLLKGNDITPGVIASIFWRQTKAGRSTAATTKWLSLFSLAAFIWLDFALFADISSRVLSVNALWFRLLLLIISCFVVTLFTLRYGLRGFVFADFFQSPLIAGASLLLLIGCLVLGIKSSPTAASLHGFFSPMLDQQQCVIFGIHVFFLNSFLVLVSESHWFRLWIFDQSETREQRTSQIAIAIMWGCLILVGLFASRLSGGQVGENAVVDLLRRLTALSPIFPVAFWLGGTAALFSSADAAIYSALIVRRFDNRSGKLLQVRRAEIAPIRYAVLVTIAFAVAYAAVRYFGLPFEKIIFVVIPLNLNLLPAFVFLIRRRRQRPIFIWLSLLLYTLASVVGFMQPERTLFWTLMAALVPVVLSVAAWLRTLRDRETAL